MSIMAIDDSDDPKSTSGAIRERRARAILEYVRQPENTNRPLRHSEIQSALRIASKRGYSEAMVLARKMALEDGESITYCVRDGDEQILFHVNLDNEAGRWFSGAGTRISSVTGQVRNVVNDLELFGTRVRNRDERLWARANATAYGMVVTMADEMSNLAREIYRGRKERTQPEEDAS